MKPCKRNAVLVAVMLVAVALSVLVSSPDAQTLERVRSFVVFDDNDKKVGRVLGIPSLVIDSVVVAFEVDQHLIPLPVTRNGFKSPDRIELWFESEDCSGQPPVIEAGKVMRGGLRPR